MKKLFFFSALALILAGCSPQPIQPSTTHNEQLSTSSEQQIDIVNDTAVEEINNDATQQFDNKAIKQLDNETTKQENNTVFEQKNVTTTEQKENPPNNETTSTEVTEDQQISTIILKVNDKTYTFPYSSDTTLYQFMQNLSTQSAQQFYFETKNYAGIGKFVTEINGLSENIRDKMYWIYYINGNPAQIGISDYIIQQGDLIEWKYEKAKF